MNRLILAVLPLAVIAGLAACGSSPQPAAPPTAPPAQTVTVTAPAPPPVTETVKVPGPARTTVAVVKTVQAPPPAPVSAIEEGVWTVGSDIAPGKYRTIDAVSDGCYWKISTSGTNGDDIVSNDNPSGGHPVVTLRKGQDFQTQDCGSWAKAR